MGKEVDDQIIIEHKYLKLNRTARRIHSDKAVFWTKKITHMENHVIQKLKEHMVRTRGSRDMWCRKSAADVPEIAKTINGLRTWIANETVQRNLLRAEIKVLKKTDRRYTGNFGLGEDISLLAHHNTILRQLNNMVKDLEGSITIVKKECSSWNKKWKTSRTLYLKAVTKLRKIKEQKSVCDRKVLSISTIISLIEKRITALLDKKADIKKRKDDIIKTKTTCQYHPRRLHKKLLHYRKLVRLYKATVIKRIVTIVRIQQTFRRYKIECKVTFPKLEKFCFHVIKNNKVFLNQADTKCKIIKKEFEKHTSTLNIISRRFELVKTSTKERSKECTALRTRNATLVDRYNKKERYCIAYKKKKDEYHRLWKTDIPSLREQTSVKLRNALFKKRFQRLFGRHEKSVITANGRIDIDALLRMVATLQGSIKKLKDARIKFDRYYRECSSALSSLVIVKNRIERRTRRICTEVVSLKKKLIILKQSYRKQLVQKRSVEIRLAKCWI